MAEQGLSHRLVFFPNSQSSIRFEGIFAVEGDKRKAFNYIVQSRTEIPYLESKVVVEIPQLFIKAVVRG